MLHYSLNPIDANLRPSSLLAVLLGGAALCACLIVMLMPLPWWLSLGFCLLAVVCTWRALLRDILLQRSDSITALALSVKGELRCMMRAGEWHEARVLGTTTVTPWLTVVNLKLPCCRFPRCGSGGPTWPWSPSPSGTSWSRPSRSGSR